MLLSGGTNVSIRDTFVLKLANSNMSVAAGAGSSPIAAVVGYALVQFNRVRSRAARGLVTDPLGIVLLRIGGAGRHDPGGHRRC